MCKIASPLLIRAPHMHDPSCDLEDWLLSVKDKNIKKGMVGDDNPKASGSDIDPGKHWGLVLKRYWKWS